VISFAGCVLSWATSLLWCQLRLRRSASSGLIRDRYCRPNLKQLNLISACYADGGEPRVDEGAPAEGGTGRILSDIGGSYPENESRLSDTALGWMAGEAKRAGLIVNDDYLHLYGRHTGPQHDECRVGHQYVWLQI
jgi:hypothetical protein